MALDLLSNKGLSLDRQKFTWKDLVQKPSSKLDDDAFTRVRVIVMNGIEMEALRFSHSFARMNADLRVPLAEIRRIEKHQQALVNNLLPPDLSPIETTICYEQVAVELTASIAMKEPDPYLAQAHRFGLLEDFDHLYRFSALLDRLEGKDANTLTQSYTDIVPGRATHEEHRAAEDDVRLHYDKSKATPLSKLHCMTLVASEQQTENYYCNISPLFADPVARQLYSEISAIEEQHVTHYESLIDPNETWMEKWLLHEATEVYNYYSCAASESNPHIRAIWERFVDYELGHLHAVMELFKKIENRDPAEILPRELPEPVGYRGHRDFVREVLNREVDLRAKKTQFVPKKQESQASLDYREQMNSNGSPSDIVSAGYRWRPGTELSKTISGKEGQAA
jgi:hypothetical protein